MSEFNPTLNRRRLAQGGALVAGAASVGQRERLLAQTERDILRFVASLELRLVDHYANLLDNFDSRAFVVAGLPADSRDVVAELLEVEQTHLATIRPNRPARTSPTTDLDDVREALAEAVDLEERAVGAYALAVREVERARLVIDLIGIHSVEARHAAWLAELLGRDPFPLAIDRSLPWREVLAQSAEPGNAAVGLTALSRELPAAVRRAIAAELGVRPGEIDFVRVTPRVWADASLGCPQPGMVYAEVQTPGYLVEAIVNGATVELHTDANNTAVRCA